jgi:hypothetical protein
MADILEFLPLPPRGQTAPVEGQQPSASHEHTAELVDVRPLSAEETQTLAPIFAAHGVELPDPRYSHVIGCVRPDGTVDEDFLVVQLRVHAEPMNLKHPQRIFRLIAAAEELIATRAGTVPVFLFAPEGRTAQLAEQSAGMQREPWVVLSKVVQGKVAPVESSDLEQMELPFGVTIQ